MRKRSLSTVRIRRKQPSIVSVYIKLAREVLPLYIGIHPIEGDQRVDAVLLNTMTVINEALVLRLLLEDRGRITESIGILLVPVNKIKQKCFQITTKQVRRSQQFQLRR